MDDLIRFPKIELHCHLDTSVRISTVAELAARIGLNLPVALREALVAPAVCVDLADYLRRVDLALQVMQHADHLERIAREYVADLAADGVIYGEVRFAPQLHTRAGLKLQEVLDAVYAGLQTGAAATGVRVGLIVCCLRHQPVGVSLEVAELAADNRDKVCALDLAGDELRYLGAPHAPAFRLAEEAGLHRTVHAGEAAGSASVWEALTELAAERIGHGCRSEQDPALLEHLRARQIALEMCPLSNVQTRAVHSFPVHPVDRLLRQGLRVTVSTDGRTVSETSVTAEFERLRRNFGWGAREFFRCQRNAAAAAFVSHEIRRELLEKIRAAELATTEAAGA